MKSKEKNILKKKIYQYINHIISIMIRKCNLVWKSAQNLAFQDAIQSTSNFKITQRYHGTDSAFTQIYSMLAK